MKKCTSLTSFLIRSAVILTSLAFCGISQAQTLPSDVIATTGESFVKSQGSLEWTLGEIMVETYTKPIGFLTQGFQQPTKVTITGIDEKKENIVVYPNPARDELKVKISQAGSYSACLYNLQGQILIRESFDVGSIPFVLVMDIEQMKAAVYILRIANILSGTSQIQKIEKY